MTMRSPQMQPAAEGLRQRLPRLDFFFVSHGVLIRTRQHPADGLNRIVILTWLVGASMLL